MATEIKLRKFKPDEQIPPYASVLFAGGRRTGKSFCGRDFLWHIRNKVYDCKVYSGTIDPDYRWEKYTTKALTHYCLEEFDEPNMLKDIRAQEKRKRLAEKYSEECPPTVMVFEDIGHLTPSIWKSKPMMAMIYNGRHTKSYVFLMLQYLIELRKGFRGSIDVAVFTRESNSQIRELIWKNFCGVIPTFQQFETVFFECTRDHRCLVVDCRANSYNIEDNLFWYKAKDRGFFHVGHPDVWNRRYTNTEEESDPEEDAARQRTQNEMPRGRKGASLPTTVKLMEEDTGGGGWGDDGEWDYVKQPKKKAAHRHDNYAKHHKHPHESDDDI